MNAPRSRPPLRPQSRAPSASLLAPEHELVGLVGIDVALQLAATMRVHALEAIVVLDHDGGLLGAAGDNECGTQLTLFAAAMAGQCEDGARREFDGGRIVAELVHARGRSFILALRGEHDAAFEAAFVELRALLAPPNHGPAREDGAEAQRSPSSADFDDFAALDFDLTPVGPAVDPSFAAAACTAL